MQRRSPARRCSAKRSRFLSITRCRLKSLTTFASDARRFIAPGRVSQWNSFKRATRSLAPSSRLNHRTHKRRDTRRGTSEHSTGRCARCAARRAGRPPISIYLRSDLASDLADLSFPIGAHFAKAFCEFVVAACDLSGVERHGQLHEQGVATFFEEHPLADFIERGSPTGKKSAPRREFFQ